MTGVVASPARPASPFPSETRTSSKSSPPNRSRQRSSHGKAATRRSRSARPRGSSRRRGSSTTGGGGTSGCDHDVTTDFLGSSVRMPKPDDVVRHYGHQNMGGAPHGE